MRRRFALAGVPHLSRQTVPAFIPLRASARPTFDLARVSRAAAQSGECGGSWRKCGRQLGDTGHACGRAWGHDLQNVPGPIRARDRDGAGVQAVEEMFDQEARAMSTVRSLGALIEVSWGVTQPGRPGPASGPPVGSSS